MSKTIQDDQSHDSTRPSYGIENKKDQFARDFDSQPDVKIQKALIPGLVHWTIVHLRKTSHVQLFKHRVQNHLKWKFFLMCFGVNGSVNVYQHMVTLI